VRGGGLALVEVPFSAASRALGLEVPPTRALTS
jgi:hypothetical protein